VDENAIVELPQVSYVAITFCESIWRIYWLFWRCCSHVF
jgi:hypothetical protein